MFQSRTPTVQPVPSSTPSDALKDRDFALYVDGKRVNAEVSIKSDGVSVDVYFSTSIEALDNPDADPKLDIAWGGWKPGDSVHLHQPADVRYPENGFVIIESIEPAQAAGGTTYFVCTALTAVHDWVNDAKVCDASDKVRIPASWFQK